LHAENIHGVCEDYRAGATIGYEMDTAEDFEEGRRSRARCW
jgi:hypothetical protein